MSDRVAVVCSVLNEAERIEDLLDSLLAQTRAPDEVVIVDGGSRDGTLDALRRRIEAGAQVRLIELPGSNISRARNAGIHATDAAIVAVTDAGVRLERDWLRKLIAPFGSTSPPEVVAGFFRPDPHTPFETALGAATLIDERNVVPEKFLPSSRSVAFRREAWAAVGGYPEWLDYCEDVVFDLALKQSGFRFRFVPDALVHFRPRPSIGAFARQYFRYARGDGKADLWRRRHAIRYGTYLAAPVVLLAGLWYKRLWLAGLVAGAAYLYEPYRRLWPWLERLGPGERAEALAWVPAIRLVGDAAKMLGYPIGVWWRLRNRR